MTAISDTSIKAYYGWKMLSVRENASMSSHHPEFLGGEMLWWHLARPRHWWLLAVTSVMGLELGPPHLLPARLPNSTCQKQLL